MIYLKNKIKKIDIQDKNEKKYKKIRRQKFIFKKILFQITFKMFEITEKNLFIKQLNKFF